MKDKQTEKARIQSVFSAILIYLKINEPIKTLLKQNKKKRKQTENWIEAQSTHEWVREQRYSTHSTLFVTHLINKNAFRSLLKFALRGSQQCVAFIILFLNRLTDRPPASHQQINKIHKLIKWMRILIKNSSFSVKMWINKSSWILYTIRAHIYAINVTRWVFMLGFEWNNINIWQKNIEKEEAARIKLYTTTHLRKIRKQ